MKMNYDEARQYIKEASKAGIRPGLSCMRELCRRLENPQDDLKTVSYTHLTLPTNREV